MSFEKFSEIPSDLLDLPPPPPSLAEHVTNALNYSIEAEALLRKSCGEIRVALWESEEAIETDKSHLLVMMQAQYSQCLKSIENANDLLSKVNDMPKNFFKKLFEEFEVSSTIL
ncbi:UNVERIFIED_CONTAM: hypothetical protein RMT77_015337 [Armadillidium vulgare]